MTKSNALKVIGKQQIVGKEFTGIEGGFGKGKRSMLVKEIASIHGQPLKEINRRINDNRKRFKDGIDIIDLLDGGLNPPFEELGFSNRDIKISNNIYILSERGYAKLLKILEDDTAWEIYDEFVDGYFTMRKIIREEKSKQQRLSSLNNTAKIVGPYMDALDLSPEVKAATIKSLYKTGGIDLPFPVASQEKYLDTAQIARELGMYTKTGKPASTAVSQLIKTQIEVLEGESETFMESRNGWQGSVEKYASAVVEKAKQWLEEHGYPTQIRGLKKNYFVSYKSVVDV
jgi:hypothetical protein